MRASGAGPGASLVCSFCGRAEDEVRKLVSGPMAFICDGCVETSMGLIRQERQSRFRRRDSGVFAPHLIKAALDDAVIGQDHAKRVLSVAVYNHYKRLAHVANGGDLELGKSNVLLIGPTGTGKTLLAETVGRIVDVPFAAIDATTLTGAGYIGQDVENVLLRLLEAADYDAERARSGIIYIDEIDKIGRRSDGLPLAHDIGGESVQQALLRMLEGGTVAVPLPGERQGGRRESLEVDTTGILFLCGGAFAGIETIVAARKRLRAVGFGATARAPGERDAAGPLREVEPGDLLEFGLIPEFVGRLPIIAALDELGKEALIEILTVPKNALVPQYRHLFAVDGVKLEITADALKGIAAAALRKGTGARGLRAVLERALLDVMFELPHRNDVEKVVIHREAVDGEAPPLYIHADDRKGTGTRGR